MKPKLKLCSECNTMKPIWKNHLGKKYCKSCWFKIKPVLIKKRSSKKEKEDKIYSVMRKEYLEQHKFCKANFEGCTKIATDVHHIEGRGKNYLKINTWMPICRNCHNYIHFINPSEARKLGFLK